jgi:hypothetical protein
MGKERDLLPWILGGLLMAGAAVAIGIGASHRGTANLTSGPASAPLAMPMPAAATVTAAPAEAVTAATPAPPAEVIATTPEVRVTPAAEASGQIWQCVTNGVKTFSNNPCGDKSALLAIGPVNTMSPPALHYARAYAPAYASEPRYTQPDAQTAAYAEQDYPDTVGADNYVVLQGFALAPRRHPEHPHRPPHHNPGPPPRRN